MLSRNNINIVLKCTITEGRIETKCRTQSKKSLIQLVRLYAVRASCRVGWQEPRHKETESIYMVHNIIVCSHAQTEWVSMAMHVQTYAYMCLSVVYVIMIYCTQRMTVSNHVRSGFWCVTSTWTNMHTYKRVHESSEISQIYIYGTLPLVADLAFQWYLMWTD